MPILSAKTDDEEDFLANVEIRVVVMGCFSGCCGTIPVGEAAGPSH